ncbi:MmcQ/YjbR family DNA-binding protein [Dankookia sp. GCM10030260]|uniref:MmcQ/YjbR family DNA-binding protein n=1 Tax=Dankookia sp. GCM10030260 TaxID=3273390 RepID=UPI00360E523C
MTAPGHAEARRLALALPGAVESAHVGKADFRVGGKIFASLPDAGLVVLKFLADQQALRVAAFPEAFAPVPGRWGRKGWTRLRLAAADMDLLQDALVAAWRNVAPRRRQGEATATSAPGHSPRS